MPGEPQYCVYDIISASGRLLYVVVTGQFSTRADQHRSNPFFPRRAKIVIASRHHDPIEAHKAEIARIAEMNPPHNQAGMRLRNPKAVLVPTARAIWFSTKPEHAYYMDAELVRTYLRGWNVNNARHWFGSRSHVRWVRFGGVRTSPDEWKAISDEWTRTGTRPDIPGTCGAPEEQVPMYPLFGERGTGVQKTKRQPAARPKRRKARR